MFRKLRLILCVLGWHAKKLDVGGYRCRYCGKYVVNKSKEAKMACKGKGKKRK